MRQVDQVKNLQVQAQALEKSLMEEIQKSHRLNMDLIFRDDRIKELEAELKSKENVTPEGGTDESPQAA